MGRIIGIDYGTKRTGLAWTDPMQIIATGVGCVDTPQLEAELRRMVEKESIEAFVLGFPLRLDGTDTDSTEAVRQFAEKLRKIWPDKPVHLWDERFSSKQALDAMIQGGVKKKRRSDKRLINEVSATLILQAFMGG